MNRVIESGRLTKAPELRQTTTGVNVATFTIAVNRRFKDKDGNRQADFFNVVAWRVLADLCGKYLVKGQAVTVSGELQNRSYEDKDGNKRYITEIVADEIEFGSRPGNTVQEDDMIPVQIADSDLPF